jgi:hypothetical protein
MPSQNLRYLSLHCNLLTDVTQVSVSFSRFSCGEIHFPHREVRVPDSVEKRPTDMLAKDAALMRSRLILRERHFSCVKQKMLSDARLEIPVPVRAHPDNPGPTSLVIAALAFFVKKVYAVGRQRLWIKWI